MSSVLSKILSLFLSVVMFFSAGIDKIDQYRFRKILAYSVSSFFKPQTSEEVKDFVKKTGGAVKGVCHPNGNFEQIKGAGIEWVRFDFPLAFDSNGEVTWIYEAYKAYAKMYADNGIKVMAVTPYPYEYLEIGCDLRTPEGKETIKKMARFYAEDLQGIVSAFQITNEMGVEHFTAPFTLAEAAEFTGIQLEAMQEVKGNIITGFNLSNITLYNFSELMKPYFDYCDYIGIDIYLGCFEGVFKILQVYDILLRFVWSYTGKPVMLNEFGYIGYGETKSKKEKTEILQGYGFNSEAEAKADIRTFIGRLPEDFREYLKTLDAYPDDTAIGNRIFDTEIANHVYKEIHKGYRLANFPHTPEGQADCLAKSIERFANLDFVCGAFVYCYSDSASCYICGQPDCPVETGWGLVDGQGNPKPSYYAVRDAFAKWKK